MELIKYLIKRYPLITIVITVLFFNYYITAFSTILFAELVACLWNILYPSMAIDYTEYYGLIIFCFALIGLMVIPICLPVVVEYILHNVHSGFTYRLLSGLRYSVFKKVIFIVFLFIISRSVFYLLIPLALKQFFILYLYWLLIDIWKTLKDKENKNIIQKIVYIPLNGVSYICRFVQELNGKIKIHLKKLLFFKKYIAAVISKTQLLCIILVNVLCSGYVFIKLLDFCWFKIVKVYFIDFIELYVLFYFLFIALWGVHQIVRFFILPNIYNFMLDNTKSGAVHSFIFSLKNTKWCKSLVLQFALIADILLAIYLYRPPFYFSHGLLEIFDNFGIYIIVFMLFLSITPIYFILYLYWHVEKQNRLEKTEKFSH